MKIELVPYCSEWPVVFEQEKDDLLNVLDQVVVKIYHIGSTAVEGLAAKPIIDIMLSVKSLTDLDACQEKIEALGYEALGEFGIEGRRYYRKGGDNRTHQIHAFQQSDAHLIRHLAFRDYLRCHPIVRDQYGELKARVAINCDNDIDSYCAGKNDFIKLHEAKALEWIRDKAH